MACVVRDWRLQLIEALPDFFAGPRARRSRPVLPDCGEGWCCVVDRLCVRIAAAREDGESFRFASIGQQDGALRVRWGGRLSAESEAAVRSAIDLAEARSLCICELCGALAKRSLVVSPSYDLMRGASHLKSRQTLPWPPQREQNRQCSRPAHSRLARHTPRQSQRSGRECRA